MNGFKMKSDAEQSPYQRRLEEIDNVILCVAEAERLVANIGKSLVTDMDKYLKPANAKKTKKIFSRNRTAVLDF